jgi:hypothetical protein
MFDIIKTCKRHGALTIKDVYVRNTREGKDCKFCYKEYAIKAREENPDKFKENGRKYRLLILPENTVSRKCSGCQKELEKNLFSPSAWKLRHPYCRACFSIANYKSKIKNKDTYQQYKVKAAESSRKSYLKKTWGMSIEDFNKLRAYQNGCCAICKIQSNILHIDHDHVTGKIRSLLCNNCNRGIGHMKESTDNLQAAINYLKFHQSDAMTQLQNMTNTIPKNIIFSE